MRQRTLPSPCPCERGSLLVPVVILTLVLGGLSVALLSEGLAERASVEHHETSLLALEVAEKGIVEAEMEIRALADLRDDGVGTCSGEFGRGRYEVVATRDPDLPERWSLQVRGEVGLSVRRFEVGIRRREDSYFVEGLFSRGSMTLDGGVTTDSYDSRLGPWQDQVVDSDGGGDYALGGGDVGSNMEIVASGTGVFVRGNAIPGPLFLTETAGQPTIWGDTLPRRVEIDLEPPPLEIFEAALANNDNAQFLPGGGSDGTKVTGSDKTGYDHRTMSLRVTGQTETVLAGGTYFFTDVVLAGGATLRVDGPSTIYVTGQLDLGGGSIVNASGKPTDCIVYQHPYPLPKGFTPKFVEASLNGGPQVAMGLYAPYVPVTVGGGPVFFGAIAGAQIKVNGDTAFHFDEALKDATRHTVVFLERLYWRELGEAPR